MGFSHTCATAFHEPSSNSGPPPPTPSALSPDSKKKQEQRAGHLSPKTMFFFVAFGVLFLWVHMVATRGYLPKAGDVST